MTDKKILIWDLETSDLDADIGHIITIGYMWFGDKKPTILSILDYPGQTLVDDSRLIEEFSKVYEQADMTVAHFGQFFDLAFLQTKRLIHGMGPLPKVPLLDTWRIAKKRLKFRSNRLERILEVLGCPYSKSSVKLSVWSLARCGDKKAIEYVKEHNRLDVLVLAWVYEKLRPFWEHHPALHTADPTRQCSICGSHKVKSKGRYTTTKHTYQLLRCFGCGHSWKGAKLEAK